MDPFQSVVRTGADTGRPARLAIAEITLRRLEDRLTTVRIRNAVGIGIPYRDHRNVVVWAGVRANGATDTGYIVDDDGAVFDRAVDGARGAANHADRIRAMHTRIRDH